MYSCFWLFSPTFFRFFLSFHTLFLFLTLFCGFLSFVDVIGCFNWVMLDLLELERFWSELHRKYSVNQMSTRNSLNPVNYTSLVENSVISTKLVEIFRCFLTISSKKDSFSAKLVWLAGLHKLRKNIWLTAYFSDFLYYNFCWNQTLKSLKSIELM